MRKTWNWRVMCVAAALAAAGSVSAWGNEEIDSSWYGDGGKASAYALVSRDVKNDNSYAYTPSPEQWRDRNIYQLFTDRFATDGNNLVKGYRPRWDCEYTGDGLNRAYPFNRNYHHGGNWNGMRLQIPYLKGMGVTAVWISGVQQNDQGVNDQRWTPYHQYHVDNFFRCDPCMGTFQDLKNLIDELHANGIAVILDVAPNHMCDKNGWGSIQDDKGFHWDESQAHWWFNDNKHCAPFDNLDRFHVNGTINNWDQSPENLMGQFKGTDDLDQDDALTSDYLYRAFKNLIDATDCDGFRVDAIKHIPYDWCRNWAQAIRNHAAWRGKSNFLMFGELFSYDTGALASWCRDGYGFNSALLFPLMQAMNGVFGYGQSSYQLGEQMNALGNYGDGKDNVIAFLDNHDVNRFAQQFGGGDAATAKKIMSPAMTFLYLAPPVPLLYYGTEHMFNQGGHGNGASRNGDEYSDQYNPDDSDWQRECMFDRGFQPGNASGDMFSDWAKERGLYYHIAWLNGLRNKCRALRRGGFEQRYYSGGQGLYAFTKWYDDEIALVVLNTADYEQEADIATGADGDFYENGDGDKYTTSGGRIHVKLDGKGSKVFIRNFHDNSADLGTAGQSSGGGDELWSANTYGWPKESATTADTIYINTEAGPAKVAADAEKNFKVYLVYAFNNPTGNWPKVEMDLNADWGSANGGWYHANLGNLSTGRLDYIVCVEAEGMETYWDHNPDDPSGNYVMEITAAPDVFFQGVSSTPTEPDDGGTLTITATVASGLDTPIDNLAASLTYAYSYKGTTEEWSAPAAMTRSAAVYTNETDTTTNLWTSFTYTISGLQGGKTLLYKVSAVNGDTTIQANGGNAYEVRITGNVSGLVGNSWHCPTNKEPYEDVCMRSPVTPKEGWTMWLRVGNYQGDADMNNGALWYRFGAGTEWTEWKSAPMEYETTVGDNNFWVGKCDIPAGQAGNFLQYYFEADYDNEPEYATTYLYMHPDNSAMYLRTTSQKEAAATPFEVGIAAAADGQEPGFIWHGGNITRSADNAVQVWAKIGYQPDNGSAWADEAVIRYRIDIKKEGKARSAGVKAIKSKVARSAKSWAALTGQAGMTLQSTVEDGGGHGKAMMWMGSIVDEKLADPNAVLIYEVYARNSKGNGNWKQAEYNAGDGSCTFEYRMWSDGSGDLTVDGTPADYTTSKFFLDEDPAKGESISVEVAYHAPDDAEKVEVFTNFGRRDYADADTNGDGWPDGMIPPDGNSITEENCADGYWQALAMSKGAGAWMKTLTTDKCGVYRITARYWAKGATNWTWYSDNPNGAARRDHVVVISPKKAMDQTMYELNVLTTKATAADKSSCGTFEGLSKRLRPAAEADADPYGEFSIDYLNRMGINCLWFQPIHPNLDYKRGNTDDQGNQFEPGSPYATKNYFSVNANMSTTKTEEGAVQAFADFVGYCDKARREAGEAKKVDTINVMLDGVMNHTSFDAVFGEGIEATLAGLSATAKAELTDALGAGWDNVRKTDTIPATKLGIQWYSHVVVTNEQGQPVVMQDAPATRYAGVDDNDIANAPERYDFGKWNDVAELLYGNYSTMVRYNDMTTSWKQNEWGDWYESADLGEETGRIYSEEDQYYYNEMRPATKLLWKYMASYPEFWIKKTGNDGANHPGVKDSDGVFTDDYGIDGLRCDYAQGLPNQFWEYCINRTRKIKWNFLFMAESLDGGKVGFRSNRQFDILNENMVFRFTQDHVSNPAQFQNELENRRAAYGNGLILLNLTCHDEIIPWGDPQATASRYAMVSAVDGVPMIFYGQEQAISTFERYNPDGTDNHNPTNGNPWVGFQNFEQNFGKWIPHFKKWNKMHVWTTPPYPDGAANDSRAMAEFYGRINQARQASPALRSQNRWFLNDTNKVMFCAKWEEEGANPNEKDAVFAAVLFLNDNMEGDHNGHWGAGCVYDISPFAAKMGIQNRADRLYNLKNIASTSDAFIWDTPKSGKELYEQGLELIFQGSWKWNEQLGDKEDLPATEWTDNGNVVQYLKVFDVTGEVPPVAPDGLTVNDPSEAIERPNGTASYDIVGMAGNDVTGKVSWVNALTGETGSFDPTTVWTQQVALATGMNVVTFTAGTKAGGTETLAEDKASNAAYASHGNYNGLNGGTGFGAWTVTPDAPGEHSAWTEDAKGFGLWAGWRQDSKLLRTLPRALKAGDTFSIVFRNGDVAPAKEGTQPGCGFGLCTPDNENAGFRIFFNGGFNNYYTTSGKDHEEVESTLGWTDGGLRITVTMSSDTAFSAEIRALAYDSSITVTGNFDEPCNAFRAWSWSNTREGADNNVYVDEPKLTQTTGGTGEPATATATIVVLPPEQEPTVVEIESVPEFEYDSSTGRMKMKVKCVDGNGDEVPPTTALTIWKATGIVNRKWNWEKADDIVMGPDGELELNMQLNEGVLVISIGEPPVK